MGGGREGGEEGGEEGGREEQREGGREGGGRRCASRGGCTYFVYDGSCTAILLGLRQESGGGQPRRPTVQ